MQRYNILWADDEIQLLKAHMMFLDQKGYDVTPVNSAVEALELVEKNDYDIVFLDENMPGMTGLEALPKIKAHSPSLPVVMITKSEEEHIMEEAIGAQISDYLIKPLNPNQILLSVKKILDNKRLVTQSTNQKYQQDFQKISMEVNDSLDWEEWIEVYKKLVKHEIEIDRTEHRSMKEVLEMQKVEADKNFGRFVEEEYESWIQEEGDVPTLSHHLMAERVFPLLRDGKKVFFILIDNLRYDQWLLIEPLISSYYRLKDESLYYSILPTTTAYARNAIFSGLLPKDIVRLHPDLWSHDDEEGGKNNNEDKLLNAQCKRAGLDVSTWYTKVFSNEQGDELLQKINNNLDKDLICSVFNFVDMMSHARTETKLLKELAGDESAYRSLTKTWFEHSPLYKLLQKLSESDYRVVITTDHGTKKVDKPCKIQGDKKTTNNLRYKQGKSLSYNESEVFTITDPERFGLPKRNVSTRYVFTKSSQFFVYPNNYNHYVKHFRDTFQHGGISMEEVLIPFIECEPK